MLRGRTLPKPPKAFRHPATSVALPQLAHLIAFRDPMVAAAHEIRPIQIVFSAMPASVKKEHTAVHR
jgi:hypothetical protein